MYVAVTILVVLLLFALGWVYTEVKEMRQRRGAFETITQYLKDQVDSIVQCGGRQSHAREATILNDRIDVVMSYHPEWLDKLLYGKKDRHTLEFIIKQLRNLSQEVDSLRAAYMLRASSKLKIQLDRYGDNYEK